MMPPAILNAPKEILRYDNKKFPTIEKNIKIIVAVNTPSKAEFIFSLAFWCYVRDIKIGVVPKGSMTTKYKTND